MIAFLGTRNTIGKWVEDGDRESEIFLKWPNFELKWIFILIDVLFVHFVFEVTSWVYFMLYIHRVIFSELYG